MTSQSMHSFSLRSAIVWSLGFHACLFLVMASPYGNALGLRPKIAATPFAATTLDVWLRTAAPAAFKGPEDAVVVPREVAAADAKPLPGVTEPPNAGDSDGAQANANVSEPPRRDSSDYQSPQLLTVASDELYGVTQSGSITVRIDVDEKGRPSNLIRLHSDVAPQIAQALEQRILAAKFRPAEQDGIACAGTLEVTLTVEPSQEPRTLGIS